MPRPRGTLVLKGAEKGWRKWTRPSIEAQPRRRLGGAGTPQDLGSAGEGPSWRPWEGVRTLPLPSKETYEVLCRRSRGRPGGRCCGARRGGGLAHGDAADHTHRFVRYAEVIVPPGFLERVRERSSRTPLDHSGVPETVVGGRGMWIVATLDPRDRSPWLHGNVGLVEEVIFHSHRDLLAL